VTHGAEQLFLTATPARPCGIFLAAMTDAKCEEYDRLQKDVEAILEKLREVTTLQLEVFRSRNQPEFIQLDKELELTVGEKERRIGALRQHAAEHRCVRPAA
jgi:hypothetical protein